MEAQCQRLQVRSKEGGKVLFAADEEEVVMTSEKFTITGEKKKLESAQTVMFLMLKHKVDKQHPQSVWGDFCHFLLIEMLLKEKKGIKLLLLQTTFCYCLEKWT